MHEAKRLGALTGIEFSTKGVAVVLIFTLISAIFFPLYIETKSTEYVILASVSMSMLLYGLLNPIVQRQNRKINIDGSIPFFITAFATLAVSGADRVEILKILARKEKLGYINEELKKIVNLTQNWKMSLGEISNFLAERTPSDLFADFLSRLGQATDSGQNFEEFLKTETSTVMANYENNYVSALYSFDLFKDIYISMLLAFAFMIAFIMIMPILIPVNMDVMMILAILAMVMGESMIVVGIKTVLPYDPIWQRTGIRTNTEIVLKIWFVGFGLMTLGLLAVFFLTPFFSSIPFYILFAVAITPLAIPSIIGSNTEKEIMKKEDMFGSFIRALSGSASSRGNIIIEALGEIQLHDFGKLTANIRDLYKRLVYRINTLIAWKDFSADTESRLVEVFSESFSESVELGSDAQKCGDIVADNFDRVTRMRKRRHSSISSFIGVMYGISAGLAFALSISYAILGFIGGIFSTFPTSFINDLGIFVAQPTNTMFTVELFIVIILFMHAFVAGTALKVGDGGKLIHGLHHFVAMVWLISITMIGTNIVVSHLLI